MFDSGSNKTFLFDLSFETIEYKQLVSRKVQNEKLKGNITGTKRFSCL
jgi:hypothetical protein